MLIVQGNSSYPEMVRKNGGNALTGNALLELVIRTISSIMVTVPLTLLNDRVNAHMTPENISVAS